LPCANIILPQMSRLVNTPVACNPGDTTARVLEYEGGDRQVGLGGISVGGRADLPQAPVVGALGGVRGKGGRQEDDPRIPLSVGAECGHIFHCQMVPFSVVKVQANRVRWAPFPLSSGHLLG